ncbi:5436_t:CDS:2, partial [Funneliformis geosporum]
IALNPKGKYSLVMGMAVKLPAVMVVGKQIDNATTFKQLDELGRKFRKHMYSQKWMLSSLKDFGGEPNEEKEYYNHLLQDLVTQESKINSLETENTSLKTSDTAHENSIKDFQNKLKAIIGDDLTT